MAVTRLPARSPLTADEIAAIRAPFRKATLLPGRAYHDESIYAWEAEHVFFRDWITGELQQQGTRSRSWTAGRYSNQEASVHAFDLMVADRYAMDGVRTGRGWCTEVEGAEEKRLRARAAAGRGAASASIPVPPTPADEEGRGQ